MKINIILVVALFAATIGAAICPAQRMVGGYNEASKTDETVVETANFAVQAQNKAQKSDFKLTAIERVEKQIVAGANYRLCLSIEAGGASEQATAVVYHNLQNQYELTSWTSGKCTGDETNGDSNAADDLETQTYKGSLNVGNAGSHIVYVGEESGDFAAFCFPNNSAVGKRILAACKNGERCQFVGKIDFEASCKPKDLAAVLSASGKIVSVESVKSLEPKKKFVATKKISAAAASAANTPETVVKNLYAAKGSSSPFFQKKSRALVDKYFTRELADLIWKDATAPGEGVGALDFDPLYYAQDTQITNFVVGKADENGVVKVRFKNMGKDEEITFFLTKENTSSKVWKIDSIGYSDAEDLGSILEYGMLTEAEMKEADSMNKLDGDYLVGTVKCSITTNKSGFWARVKCDDQENFQVVDTETMTFGTFNSKEKGRRGHFVSPEYGKIEKFVDASGKEYKVKRVK